MKEKYPDFWSVLFTTEPIGFFIGYTLLAIGAAFVISLYRAWNKYQEVSESPDRWSWGYFLRNELGNFLASVIFIPFFIRGLLAISNHPAFMVFFSIGTGFGFFALAKLANKWGIWTTNSLSKRFADKINEKEKEKEE